MTAFGHDERAVSKVIGVVLMVAIVVALAATVGFMVVGFGDMLNEPAPQVAFEATYHDDVEDPDEFNPDLPSDTSEVLVITHNAGDRFDPETVELVIRDADGELYRESWRDASTGQDGVVGSADTLYPHAYGSGTLSDKRVQLIWTGDGSHSSMVLEWSGEEETG